MRPVPDGQLGMTVEREGSSEGPVLAHRTSVYRTPAHYVAAFPEGALWAALAERRSAQSLDAAFITIEDPARWNALPGGCFMASLFPLQGTPAQIRLHVRDNDDGDWFQDWPAEAEAEARRVFQDMLALAPFSPGDLGPVFGVWHGGAPPAPRPKRRLG